jgi:hypothetical protein
MARFPITSGFSDHCATERKQLLRYGLAELQRPFLFIGPVSGILLVDRFFDIFNLATFFIHCIRIQRNVLADLSADAVAIRVTVQIVLVPIAHIAATVTGHLFEQFRSFLGNSIHLRDSTGK